MEDADLNEFYSLTPLFKSRNISVQFGFLQKFTSDDASSSRYGSYIIYLRMYPNIASLRPSSDVPKELTMAPADMRHILCKLDMSFLDDSRILMSLIYGCSTHAIMVQLVEMKFVQCKAVTDEFLAAVAQV
jgi:hypothetical protein